jgi:hypothetical protein
MNKILKSSIPAVMSVGLKGYRGGVFRGFLSKYYCCTRIGAGKVE